MRARLAVILLVVAWLAGCGGRSPSEPTVVEVGGICSREICPKRSGAQ
ncbi:MAG TPA: hypothetical protein VGW35_09130 [Methylomirabilota bacterium]|jgi:hypothetical protein|nr:hypothetical protein [Methylomirabilota bacterium]